MRAAGYHDCLAGFKYYRTNLGDGETQRQEIWWEYVEKLAEMADMEVTEWIKMILVEKLEMMEAIPETWKRSNALNDAQKSIDND